MPGTAFLVTCLVLYLCWLAHWHCSMCRHLVRFTQQQPRRSGRQRKAVPRITDLVCHRHNGVTVNYPLPVMRSSRGECGGICAPKPGR
jgi:hypothetical protein